MTGTPSSEMMPVLDFAPYLDKRTSEAERERLLDGLAEKLRAALTDVGFYYLAGAEALVPDALVQEVFGALRRYHDLDLQQKLELKLAPPQDNASRGYMANMADPRHREHVPEGETMKFVTSNTAFNEAFFASGGHGTGLDESPFPDNHLPELRTVLQRYDAAVGSLVARMLPVYARALGMPLRELEERFQDAMHQYRLTHYPETPPPPPGGKMYGIWGHADPTFFTICAPNPIPGLSIKLPSGTWMPVPPLPRAFVINTGETLHRLSNGRFRNTIHRVENHSGAERYAVICFVYQDRDAVMRPIVLPGEEAKWADFNSLDLFREVTGRDQDSGDALKAKM